MAPSVKQRKIAILGSRSVGTYHFRLACARLLWQALLTTRQTGKSSLTVQYCEGHFVESYYPTIENTFSHEIVHKGQTYLTEIIDTAGQVCQSCLGFARGLQAYMSCRMNTAC
jgi:hypothetical protein